MIKYLKFDSEGITSIGCMMCGRTIACRKERDGQSRVVHGVNSKTRTLEYDDSTWGTLLVCVHCIDKPLNRKVAEKTLNWGWEAELDWKLNTYKDREKYKLKDWWERKFGKCKVSENGFNVPEQVMEKLYSKKKIVGEKKNGVPPKQI